MSKLAIAAIVLLVCIPALLFWVDLALVLVAQRREKRRQQQLYFDGADAMISGFAWGVEE